MQRKSLNTAERILHPIRAIVFDAFGTLLQLGEQRHPYRRLLNQAAKAGRTPQPNDAVRVMSMDSDIRGVADWLGVSLTTEMWAELEADLSIELASVSLFPETWSTLEVLRQDGIRIGLCSNLARPYAAPVLDLLPFTLEAYAWSFEVGAVKPEAFIYQTVCGMLDLPPEEILMIGDTHVADCVGPRTFGMQALHLARSGTSPDARFIQTLDEVFTHLQPTDANRGSS